MEFATHEEAVKAMCKVRIFIIEVYLDKKIVSLDENDS